MRESLASRKNGCGGFLKRLFFGARQVGLLARFRLVGQLYRRTVKPRMIAYAFRPPRISVGEPIAAGYGDFFISVYGARLLVMARATVLYPRPILRK